jgi:protein arginine kinase activator
MVCDNCKKNEAVLHFIQIDSNGELNKFDLCKECASELSLFSFGESEETEFSDASDAISILAIDLGFFLDKLGKEDTQKTIGRNFKDDGKCSYCGTSLNSIKKTGRVGCPKCYEDFELEINPFIKIIQAEVEHKGKIPVNCNEILKIEKKIKDLKHKLEDQIVVENFEEAAKLRDKITNLQEKLHYSGKKSKK